MKKTENFAPEDATEHQFERHFDDAMGKLETLEIRKLRSPDDLMGIFEALDHEFFSNGLIRLYRTLSNLWARNFNWEILDVMQAEKECKGP